jgi:hypothetical protein
MTHPQLTGDRGVSAVIIAICAIVIFGIAAYVVDLSALYTERRELQNGADAAALAIATDCAEGDCGDPDATAGVYVDGNAHDGDANVREITFPGTNTVRVVSATADAGPNKDGDASTLDFVFAPIFGNDGQEVSAAAAASWGAPLSGPATLPITFSLCEFDYFMANGGFANYPFDGSEGDPHVIYFHAETGNGNGGGGGNTDPADCSARPGHDSDDDGRLPGGFGWLDHIQCETPLTAGSWVPADPGNGPAHGCLDIEDKIIFIPVFDDISVGYPAPCNGPGGKCYRIHGFAAFYVTGFRFPGNNRTNPAPCTPPDTCLAGYFIEYVFDLPGSDTGGPDLGASIVELTE